MSKIMGSTFAKISAIFLLVVFAASFLLGIAAIIVLSECDVYIDNGTSMRYSVYRKYVREAESEVMSTYVIPKLREDADGGELYHSYSYQREYLLERYSEDNSNIFFSVTDSKGKVLFENYTRQDSRFRYSNEWMLDIPDVEYEVHPSGSFVTQKAVNSTGNVRFYVVPDGDISVDYTDARLDEGGTEVEYVTETLTFVAGVAQSFTAKDMLFHIMSVIDFFIAFRYGLVAVCGASLVIGLFLFVFLLYSAGHRKDREDIYLEPQDKIPFDLYTVLALGGICLIVYIAMTVLDEIRGLNIIISVALIAGCLLMCLLLGLSLILTFATRVKYGKWWRNTVIFRVFYFIFKAIRCIYRKIAVLVTNIPMFWKTAVVFGLISLFEFIILVSTPLSSCLMWWFTEKFIVGGLIFFTVIDMKKIKKGGEEIAAGNTEYKIKTDNMFGDFKKHAMYLNSVSEGMQNAVNDRMKSERLKTELITNVSHDLKTPLTSIVNYVDLMKKEDIQPQKAKEYLEVLDRQSKKLQKLTVDLLEASKASTGNIAVNTELTDINVFLSQLSGEYAEKLTASSLELIIDTSEENIVINADGRLLWRVFDNLMNNICKYTLENTRVYVSAYTQSGRAYIEFKNISKYQLNISSDELMERFVRGDQSRNTEGSGLGLSIAKSLTELQKGTFNINIDGDLFKAVVSFELCK